ncbi:hypothetical protein EV562_113222 [Streptomyces sp. BK208]|uniref:hypothetical protein n=1 Tax=Streptomyces sp. BK208 TaxID=2512150 RepID=UPI0010D14EE5|nr:hypothetical protein [Streptomyces sp. BK208]TDT29357.1 hypothetical protein EV562_113222 [Streptomyces sp. BK208]
MPWSFPWRLTASAPAAPEPYADLAELWQDRRPEPKQSFEVDSSLSAVPAQAYFLFLDGDMDDAVMALGSVTGARPDVARGAVPWFGEARLLGAVSAQAPDEACPRTLDYGHDPSPRRAGGRPRRATSWPA